MIEINPDWLVDTISIALKIGEGDYNVAKYAEPITIGKVRVDLTKQYSGTGNDRTVSANATVFLYAEFSTNYPQIGKNYLQAKVIFDGHEYILDSFNKFHDIESDEPYSIELGLI